VREFKFEISPVDKWHHSITRALTGVALGSLVLVALLLCTTNVLENLVGNSERGGIFLSAAVLLLIGCVSVLGIREALYFAMQQMVFVLDNSEIVRKRRGYPDLRIAFSDVGYLGEEGGWLIIKSVDQQSKIGIPRNMVGYSAIRAELLRHHAATAPRRFRWRDTGILLLAILSWTTLLVFDETALMLLAGAVGLLTVAMGSRYLWRIWYERNRLLLSLSLSVMWFVAVLLIYLRLAKP